MLDCLATSLLPLPALTLSEYGRSGEVKRSGCHAGVRVGVSLITRSFRCLLKSDAELVS